MARLPRIVLPGQPLHVIQRGNNRSATFFADRDYRFYLKCLRSSCSKYDCAIHAYVLMDNHVHLLVTPRDETGASSLMQSVGRRYVRYINDTYQRTGSLWEGRFRSSLIESERYLLVCARYIELNPVRAGMVSDPSAHYWSSYRANALGAQDNIVEPHPIYERLGCSKGERTRVYRALFEGHIEAKLLDQIRRQTNQGGILGNDRFRREIEEAVGRRVTRLVHGGDRRSRNFCDSSC